MTPLKKLWFNGVKCLLRETTLTSRVPTEEKFSDLIINKDEKTVGECAKPPGRSVGMTREPE